MRNRFAWIVWDDVCSDYDCRCGYDSGALLALLTRTSDLGDCYVLEDMRQDMARAIESVTTHPCLGWHVCSGAWSIDLPQSHLG